MLLDVIIGHRGDDRKEQLLEVLSRLQSDANAAPRWYRITLVEQDTEPRVNQAVEQLVDDYVFCKSDRPYNRSWSFNVGAARSKSQYLLLHDGDIPISELYVRHAVKRIQLYDAVVPWKEIHYLTETGDLSETEQVLSSSDYYGGSMIISRHTYNTVGGMDERFLGWGAEDSAFMEKLKTLGKRVSTQHDDDPCLYHLYHSKAVAQYEDTSEVGEKNRALHRWYCESKEKDIRALLKSSDPIGNPNKYA